MNTKILASLVVIGAIGAVAGGATFAEFSDTETSEDNVFTAGELDLKLDWQESYNGKFVEAYPDNDPKDNVQDDVLTRDEIAQDEYGSVYSELTDQEQEDVENQFRNQFTEAEPIFQLDDVKPGDHGEATISTHVFDNPAWLWVRFRAQGLNDNDCTEPEETLAGDETCGEGDGELQKKVVLQIWNDDGDNVWEPCTDIEDDYTDLETGDQVSCTEERTDTDNANGEQPIYYGTVNRLNNDANHVYVASNEDESDQTLFNGALLDGDAFDEQGDFDEHPNSTTNYLGVRWHLPFETGNVVQTDSMNLTMDFYAQQYRHNDVNPPNPWNDEVADVGQAPS